MKSRIIGTATFAVALAITLASAATAVPARPAAPVRSHQSLPKVAAFGDSVMLGAKPDIRRVFGGSVNARESRQADPTLAAARRTAHHHRLHPLVVLHVGTNGTVDRGPLRRTLHLLQSDSQVRRIEVLTVHVPRPWQGPNNRLLRHMVRHYSHAVLVDWHRAANRHPSWVYSDGIHLTPEGQQGYTRLLRSAYRASP
jgi:hypothetical protein